MNYNKKMSILAVISSAILYGISFLYAPMAWGVVVFLIPIIGSCYKNIPIGLCTGALWSIIAFAMHAFGIFFVVVKRGTDYITVVFLLTCFALYCSLYSMLWLWAVQKKPSNDRFTQMIYRTIVTLFFFVAIDTFFLFPLGVVQGYPLFFPVIPLVNSTVGVFLITYIQQWFLFFLVIALQESIVFMFLCTSFSKIKKTIIFALLLSVFLWPIFFTPAQKQELRTLYNTDEIVCILECKSGNDPREHAQLLYELLLKARNTYPQVKTFIMRESAFPFSLNEHLYVVEMWQKNIMQEGDSIIFGSAWKEGEECSNCFFCIDTCRITHRYEKSHLIPLFEYIPSNLFFKDSLKSLFFQKKDLFSPGSSLRNPFKMLNQLQALPVLCSELFWNKRPLLQDEKKDSKNHILICLMHDGHFENSGYDQRMILTARYRACVEQRTIIYCSFFHAALIGTKGQLCELNKIIA